MATAQERKVPVLRSDNSLIDQEFDSIKEKFEAEMHKMEAEMARFRSQLIESERSRLVSSSSMSSSSVSSSSSSSQQQQQQVKSSSSWAQNAGQQQQEAMAPSSWTNKQQSFLTSQAARSATADSRHQQQLRQHQQHAGSKWLQELSSPLIKEGAGGEGKVLKLRFDVTQYEPEQIVVKTVDNRLHVHARREEKTANTSMYREYNREFLLPAGTDPELIRSSLSADGVLTVEAPLPAADAVGAVTSGGQ